MVKVNENPQVSNELLFFQAQDSQSIKCYKQTIPINIYHFYINDEIDDYKQYQDLINTLKTAEENDKIFIYLNSPGGRLNIAIQIVNAMRSSRATVITSMDGEVCSAATLIFLCGHEYTVNKNCSFMIHNYSGGIYGKGNEMASSLKHHQEYFENLANDIYGGFLSKEEIKDMLDGKDIWMGSDEVLERLHKMLEIRKKEMEEQEEEQKCLKPQLSKKKIKKKD